MHILKCEKVRLVLQGEYCGNIEKTLATITFFIVLSNGLTINITVKVTPLKVFKLKFKVLSVIVLLFY